MTLLNTALDCFSNIASAAFSSPYTLLSVMFPLDQALPLGHAEGERQFNEIAIPRDVKGETGHKLIEKGKKEAEALRIQLATVTDVEISQLLTVIDTLDFKSDSILLNLKLPFIALEALRRGLLHPEHGQKQVATILNFWAALQYHGDQTHLETISVFDPQASELIRKTLNTPTGMPFLEGDKFNIFMKKMGALPESEQRFLLVPNIQGNNSTISRQLHKIGVNVFNRLNVNGKPMRIIPSTGMMQAFLDAQYGEEAVEIKHLIYFSTLRHIYDSRLSDTCDMMFPIPDAQGQSQCPPTADGFLAPWYDFTHHDFYHSIVSAAVGKTYRKVGVVAADAIRAYAKTAPTEDQKGLRQLAISMIDMDYPNFLHFIKIPGASQEHSFWFVVDQQLILQTLKARATKEGLPPFSSDFISDESQIGAFKKIYDTLIQEQKGPAQLNVETFRQTVQIIESGTIPYSTHFNAETFQVIKSGTVPYSTYFTNQVHSKGSDRLIEPGVRYSIYYTTQEHPISKLQNELVKRVFKK